MGIFNKKKTPFSSDSVLSESEIQKKLYGDILTQAPHVVLGDREPVVERTVPPLSRKTPSEKEPPADLFTEAREPVNRPEIVPPVADGKAAEHAPRYVPLHDFENKSPTQSSSVSRVEASPSRFSSNRSASKWMASAVSVFKEAKIGRAHV